MREFASGRSAPSVGKRAFALFFAAIFAIVVTAPAAAETLQSHPTPDAKTGAVAPSPKQSKDPVSPKVALPHNTPRTGAAVTAVPPIGALRNAANYFGDALLEVKCIVKEGVAEVRKAVGSRNAS
jgi:hypothetical protein